MQDLDHVIPQSQSPPPTGHASIVSDELLRLAMDSAAIGMCVMGPDGSYERVNPAMCEMLGRRVEEFATLTWQDITHPDDIAADLSLVREVAAGRRRSYRLLKRYVHADGHLIWGDLSVAAVLDPAGSVRHYVAQIVDVTERVDAEQALAESERRYRLLADNASDVIILVAPDDTYRWVSPSVRDILGWEPEEGLGRTLLDFVHPDDVPKILEVRNNYVDGIAAVDEVRCRRADGTYLWMSARAKVVTDERGRRAGRVVTMRDIHTRVLARHELAESERRFRMLAENASDVVMETGPRGGISWISPSVERVLGWRPEQLIGRRAIDVLIAPEDTDVAHQSRTSVLSGSVVEPVEMRFLTSTDERRWMSAQSHPIRDASGAVTSAVVALRDCQLEVVNRRAMRTLSAANAILTRAERETDLLDQMCETAVKEGGYLLAWYARALRDAERHVDVVAASPERRGYLDEIQISWGDGPLGHGPTGTALRERKVVIVTDFQLEATLRPWCDIASRWGLRSSINLPVVVDGELDGVLVVYAGEPDAFDEHATAVMEDLASQLGYGIGRLRDAQRLVEALNDQKLLGTAIDQAAEAVIVTDDHGDIVYANPAAVRSGGYTLGELIGRNVRLFRSGVQDRAFFRSMFVTLGAGNSWHGVLISRRKNGELYEEDTTIAPVNDPDGRRIAYVVVKHDLSVVRRLEADLVRQETDREAIVELMGRVRPGATLTATGTAFCEAAAALDGIDAVALLMRRPGSSFTVVARAGIAIPGLRASVPIPLSQAGRLDEAATSGPGAVGIDDPSAAQLVGPAFAHALRSVGISALGHAAVPSPAASTTGVLIVATRRPGGAETMASRLGLLEQLASFAGSLFGPQAEQHGRVENLRDEVRRIIDDRAFRVVFQPVVDVRTGTVHGYEALTRFHDGVQPELRFVAAHSVGLGPELEAALAEHAVTAARSLPPELWVSVNFSPPSILDGHAASALQDVERPIVIEITEHFAITDYPAMRAAIAGCGDVRISVDDAGAGFASLRHILELRPDIVKLDLDFVRGIDTDPARQALAAGLCHFGARTGTTLVAEGVETEAEAAALVELGIPLAQGNLFGAPAPLD